MRRRRLYPTFMIALLATCVVLLISCQRHAETGGFQPEISPLPQQLAAYEAMPIPADNPMTLEKVALGRQLFFDER